MVQIALLIITIIDLITNKFLRLQKTEASMFPDAPVEMFDQWKKIKGEQYYYANWVGWKLFFISILTKVTGIIVPETAMPLQLGLLAAIIFCFVKYAIALIQSNKLAKEYGFQIAK